MKIIFMSILFSATLAANAMEQQNANISNLVLEFPTLKLLAACKMAPTSESLTCDQIPSRVVRSS